MTRSVFSRSIHTVGSGNNLRFVSSGNIVKVFLRNILNGWYYKGPSRWTPRQQEAKDLGQAAWAVEMVFQEHLENVEIVLCYDDPRHNLVLPVEREQHGDDIGKLDVAGEAYQREEKSPEKRGKKKPPL